jgi:peptide/nickel transport system substrate-binding protein
VLVPCDRWEVRVVRVGIVHSPAKRFTVAGVALVLILAACGDDDEPAATTAAPTTAATTAATTTATSAPDAVTTTPAETEGGGTAILTTSGDTAAPSVFFDGAFDDLRIRNLNWDKLFIMDLVTGELEPRLATDLTASEDGLEWTLTLREGVTWNDGEPFTADDVIWTLETIASPDLVPTGLIYSFAAIVGLPEYAAGEADSIPGLVKVDDHTVKLVLSAPAAGIRYRLGYWLRPAPKHIWEDVPLDEIAEHPGWLNDVVSSGPFKLIKYELGQTAEYEANENYYLGPPKLDKIIVRIADYDGALAAMEAGDVHLVPNAKALDAERLADNPDLKFQDDPGLQTWGLYMNYKIPELQDLRVRLAFAHAFDRDSYVREILGGFGNPDVKPMMIPGTAYAAPELDPYPYDPEKARALLEEADFDFDQTITVGILPTNEPRAAFALVMQDNLRDIGVTMEIEPIEEARFSEEICRLAMEDAWFVIAFIALVEDPFEDVFRFHSSNTTGSWPTVFWRRCSEEQRGGLTAAEYIGYTPGSPELDALIDQVSAASGLEAALPTFHEIDRYLYENVAFINFVAPSQILGWRSELVGPGMQRGGGESLYWLRPETWFLNDE